MILLSKFSQPDPTKRVWIIFTGYIFTYESKDSNGEVYEDLQLESFGYMVCVVSPVKYDEMTLDSWSCFQQVNISKIVLCLFF